MKSEVSIIIPAYNEANRIKRVIEKVMRPDREVIVIDDGSNDRTGEIAKDLGARVIKNDQNIGYVPSIKKGFREAKGEISVTLDADGEHEPGDIDKLTAPLLKGKYDLALGVRGSIARPSERLINRIVNIRVPTSDCGTGMRAIRTDLARSMEIRGYCTCGTFLLEAWRKGAATIDVPVRLNKVDKGRRTAWEHIPQTFIVILEVLRGR
ncbi:MAG: glycosyltransferase family 2 protein [Thermoplasmatota archaeon]